MLPVATEYGFTCRCGHHESWSTQRAAEAAAVWHVYDDHHDEWVDVSGDRTPIDPRPAELGAHKFEAWESQL